MSRHVPPHLWADAFAGRLDEAERAELDRHADGCTKCRKARTRVRQASDTFPIIRTQQPPELGWDSVRARVHWSVSTARHQKVSMRRYSFRPRLGLALGAGALVAAGGIALFFATTAGSSHHATTTRITPPVAKKGPPALTALVSRLAGDVMIDGIRPASTTAAFEHALGAGTVLATGNGRIDVQFGEASAFALGPRSTLEVKHLDAETIELVVDGVVDVDVAPRAKGQRFVVVAGDQTVEVRGTRFSVTHDPHGTRVACQHGLVAVSDTHRTGTLEVGAARTAFVAANASASLADAHVIPLTAEELGRLAKTTPWTTPGWNPDLAIHSAPLEIATPGKRDVRVDGIELGEAPLQMRVMPGRHTIETTDGAGRFHRAGWVDVSPSHPAKFEAMPSVDEPAAPTTNAGITLRKKQFAAGIDHERLRSCTRRLAKAGITDTVEIEISIDAYGAVNVLNVIDTDLPTDTASCVHDVLSDVRFAAGPAASWRDKIRL